MRVSPVGLLANSVEEVSLLSTRVTEVTHNHPEGLKGAEATALAIFLARQRVTAQNIKIAITESFGYDSRAPRTTSGQLTASTKPARSRCRRLWFAH